MFIAKCLALYQERHRIKTMTEFARLLSFPGTEIYDIEVSRVIKQHRAPSPKMYRALSRLFNLDEAELIGICERGNVPSDEDFKKIAAVADVSVDEIKDLYLSGIDLHGTKKEKSIKVVPLEDIAEGRYPSLSLEDVILQIEKNDSNNYKDIYDDAELRKAIVEGDQKGEFIWERFLTNLPTYCAVLIDFDADTPKVVGDWQIAPISKKQKEDLESGKIVEGMLDDEAIPRIDMPGKYHLFLLNFSINPTFYKPKYINLLQESFYSSLKEYEEYKIEIVDILYRPLNKTYQQLGEKMHFIPVDMTRGNAETKCYYVHSKWPLYYLNDIDKLLSSNMIKEGKNE